MPIDMYGVEIGGAAIKPYMVFGAIIIMSNIWAGRSIKIPVPAFLVMVLILASDCANGFIIESFMQHAMFILIVVIAVSYVRALENTIDLDMIKRVTVSATIGFGATFALAYVVMLLGLNIGGVYTADRFAPGIFLNLMNAGGVSDTRLRGFYIDPNTVVTTLLPGACFSLYGLLRGEKNTLRDVSALILYTLVVALSGSRTAMACSAVIFAILFISAFRKSQNKALWVIASLFVLTLMIRANLLDNMMNYVLNTYTERATLTSESGRATIWIYNAMLLVKQNKLLFGVGQNQIQHLSTTGLECHNTWLEWICGAGLVAGGAAIYWFFSVPQIVFRKARDGMFRMQTFLPLLFAYCAICLCITTVDNITNSCLIFLAIICGMGNLRTSAI